MLSSIMNRIYMPELYEGLSDASGNDTSTPDASGNDTSVVGATGVDTSVVDTSVVDATGDDTPATDATGVDTSVADATGDDTSTTDASGNDTSTTTKNTKNNILTTSNFNMAIMFIFLYIVAYTLLGVFYKHDGNITMSFLVDMMFTVIVAGVFYVLYYSLDSNQQQELLNEKWKETKEYVNDEYSIAYQTISILLFYAFIYLFRIPMGSGSKPAVIFMIETLGWLLLLFILTNQFFIAVFNVSLVDDFGKLFENKLNIQSKDIKTPEEVAPKEEVFNVSGNKYTYDDAQAVCKSYGSSLATYDQVESAYNSGAEWCNYGWSANQMAFFPTQKQTWQKLQVSDKYKNSCGRPGVNGGYMRNPNIRFGVNCFGTKPKPNDDDLKRIENNEPSRPIQNDLKKELEEKVDTSSFVLSGFNYNQWNK